MSNEDKIAILANSVNRLANSPKNIKAPGVLKKRRRQLRNLEAK